MLPLCNEDFKSIQYFREHKGLASFETELANCLPQSDITYSKGEKVLQNPNIKVEQYSHHHSHHNHQEVHSPHLHLHFHFHLHLHLKKKKKGGEGEASNQGLS